MRKKSLFGGMTTSGVAAMTCFANAIRVVKFVSCAVGNQPLFAGSLSSATHKPKD